ncbi:MAG: trehalose-phosphatase, partial [Actinomycetota bacterium]|nr:trehalose-phosphatase [Actinomycetota bacterium]
MNREEKSRITVECSNYDAFIFDLDGVMTRTAKIHAQAWKEMFDSFLRKKAGKKNFKPFDIEKDYPKYLDGKQRYEGVRSFLESISVELPYGDSSDSPEKETICGLGNKKNQIFQRLLKEMGTAPYPSSIALVKNLKKVGMKVAVASSSKNCSQVLDAANISELFDAKVDGVDLESLDLKGKPSPDMFIEAARRLSSKPERSVVLEDAISGVRAGKNGNFGLVIGVDRVRQREALLKAGAHIVVEDLSEIEAVTKMESLRHALEYFSNIREEIEYLQPAIFLDYDGTLTPIVSRPEEATLDKETRKTLTELPTHCFTAIVSGRDLTDIRKMVKIKELWYAGSHGFEIESPDGTKSENEEALEFLPPLEGLEKMLSRELKDIPGSLIERKRFSIAVHYRNVKDEMVNRVKEIVENAGSTYPEFRITKGKKVLEFLPDIDWHKGRAVAWIIKGLNLDRPSIIPLYIGDDITDEDVFEELKTSGITIAVGSDGRTTKAHYRLTNTEEVKEFLDELSRCVEDESTWWFTSDEFDPAQEGLRESLTALGNGYFVTRGAAPESRADGIHYPGTYLAGGYNRLKTKIAGRVVENEDLVNMPNWLCLNFFVDGDPLDIGKVKILFYSQELDIKSGVLYRTIRLRDSAGRETKLESRRIVSMANMHLAALETTIEPLNWSGKIKIHSAVDGTVVNDGVARYRGLNNKHLAPVKEERVRKDTVLLEVKTTQSKLGVAEAMRTRIFKGDEPLDPKRKLVDKPGYVGEHIEVKLQSGERITVEKTVALFSSRDNAISEWGCEAENLVADAGRFQSLLRSHRIAWEALWRKFSLDLAENSTREAPMERILRLYSFHLLQTTSTNSIDLDIGMPSRGWHGEAYRGHIFWDELIIFPFLNYRIPEITRSLLMYRYRRLGEARKAAKKIGYKGAMFPWQSGSNGREETQQLHLNPQSGNWLPDNSHLQRHVNSAIAYNVWQYYQVTGDLEFLAWYGAEIIWEIARYWASAAKYNAASDRYEIRGVMGPDEYHDGYPGAEKPGIDNNAYTNIMVVFVMNRALELLDLLSKEDVHQISRRLAIEDSEIAKWREISRKMYIPFHDDGIISQFEGYDDLMEFDWEGYRKRYGNIQRLDRILEAEGDTTNRYKVSKQADVLMLFYIFSAEELGEMFEQLGYRWEPSIIPRNIDYYLRRTSNGSSLSWIVHSWVAARSDRHESWELFNIALLTDFVDIQGGTTPEGIH